MSHVMNMLAMPLLANTHDAWLHSFCNPLHILLPGLLRQMLAWWQNCMQPQMQAQYRCVQPKSLTGSFFVGITAAPAELLQLRPVR